ERGWLRPPARAGRALRRASRRSRVTAHAAGRRALAVALAGLIALAVAIGIGRFAFTPILPMMQEDAGVSMALGGWLASANYVGYLAGALSVIWWRIGGAAGIRGGLAAGGSPRAGRGGERWR